MSDTITGVSKKVVIFDIDGTAVDSPVQKLPNSQLSSEIDRLKDKYFFCAATGRVWTFAKPVLEALKLSDLSIISAGTQICNPRNGSILWQKNLDQDALDEAITIFQQYENWKLLYNDNDENEYFNGGISPSEFQNQEPVYFLEQVFVPDIIAKEIYEKLKDIKGASPVMVVAQKPGTRDIHVINAKATKEHAIQELLNKLGVDKKDTIGIGDGYNDIHLFNGVGYKVAMGNAVPELKEMADLVIDSVSENGLAKYLKTLG